MITEETLIEMGFKQDADRPYRFVLDFTASSGCPASCSASRSWSLPFRNSAHLRIAVLLVEEEGFLVYVSQASLAGDLEDDEAERWWEWDNTVELHLDNTETLAALVRILEVGVVR